MKSPCHYIIAIALLASTGACSQTTASAQSTTAADAAHVNTPPTILPPLSERIDAPVGYTTPVQVLARFQTLAAEHTDRLRVSAIGVTRDGDPILLAELAAPGDTSPSQRPAVLILAGLDARHRVGTMTALNLVEQMLTQAADADSDAAKRLTACTLYVIPCADPSGMARLFDGPDVTPTRTRPFDPRNNRPTDDDRDDLVDEDPAEDLNGDGIITMMRVKGREPTHIIDETDPRLMRKADAAKGETPVYELYTEGIDNDEDGQYNEDGPGGVSLFSNFPHEYQEHAADAGTHAIGEPTSLALADFMVVHPNIQAVLVYGPHDNLLHVPAGKKRDVTGKSYHDLHPDDVEWHKQVAEKFKELTELEGAPQMELNGAFHAWCYSQRAIPSFATALWWMPKPAKKDGDADGAASSQPTAEAVATQPGDATADADQVAASQKSGEVKPDADAKSNTSKSDKGKRDKKPEETDDHKWLKYADAHPEARGFIDWQPFDHPTLGAVEIGGFAPDFRINPPADALPDIAERQTHFVLDLLGRLPQITIDRIEVTSPSAGVYAIELFVVNNGYFSTAPAILRNSRTANIVSVRPELEPQRILGGPRQAQVRWLNGSGGRQKLRWLVAGTAGESVVLHMYYAPIGETTFNVTLEPTK